MDHFNPFWNRIDKVIFLTRPLFVFLFLLKIHDSIICNKLTVLYDKGFIDEFTENVNLISEMISFQIPDMYQFREIRDGKFNFNQLLFLIYCQRRTFSVKSITIYDSYSFYHGIIYMWFTYILGYYIKSVRLVIFSFDKVFRFPWNWSRTFSRCSMLTNCQNHQKKTALSPIIKFL